MPSTGGGAKGSAASRPRSGADADDALTLAATIQGGSPLVFEGATANGFETTLAVTDPTDDNTITVPDASGTLVLVDASSNNVGIGTSGAATEKLEVNGKVKATHFCLGTTCRDTWPGTRRRLDERQLQPDEITKIEQIACS